LTFVLRRVGIASIVQQQKHVLSLHVCHCHADNAMNFSIMKLNKAIIAPALVRLAMGQNACILHLTMLKCYNSTAASWYQIFSK
jgi:hypothetical protein